MLVLTSVYDPFISCELACLLHPCWWRPKSRPVKIASKLKGDLSSSFPSPLILNKSHSRKSWSSRQGSRNFLQVRHNTLYTCLCDMLTRLFPKNLSIQLADLHFAILTNGDMLLQVMRASSTSCLWSKASSRSRSYQSCLSRLALRNLLHLRGQRWRCARDGQRV